MNWKGEGAKEFLMATIKANVPWWHRASAQKSLEAWAYPLIRPRLYLARFNPGGGRRTSTCCLPILEGIPASSAGW